MGFKSSEAVVVVVADFCVWVGAACIRGLGEHGESVEHGGLCELGVRPHAMRSRAQELKRWVVNSIGNTASSASHVP